MRCKLIVFPLWALTIAVHIVIHALHSASCGDHSTPPIFNLWHCFLACCITWVFNLSISLYSSCCTGFSGIPGVIWSQSAFAHVKIFCWEHWLLYSFRYQFCILGSSIFKCQPLYFCWGNWPIPKACLGIWKSKALWSAPHTLPVIRRTSNSNCHNSGET